MQEIKTNKVRCKLCGDVIESKSAHDFKFCKCGAIAVDGGHKQLYRTFNPNCGHEYFDVVEELSEWKAGEA